MKLCGGRIIARSTIFGSPFSFRNEISASPVASDLIASSVLNSEFGLKEFAAALIAFSSDGV